MGICRKRLASLDRDGRLRRTVNPFVGSSSLPPGAISDLGECTPHTVSISYVRDGGNVVAVCDDFGLAQKSNWSLNAIANPQVTT